MKKILVASLLAISAIALTQQEASAWVNSRFGIGMNWDYQSGGNSAFWGLWRNGQPPGPEAYGHGAGGPNCPRPAMGHPYGVVQPHAAPSQVPGGFTPVPGGFGPPPNGAFAPQAQHGPFNNANYVRPVYHYPNPYQR